MAMIRETPTNSWAPLAARNDVARNRAGASKGCSVRRSTASSNPAKASPAAPKTKGSGDESVNRLLLDSPNDTRSRAATSRALPK